MKQFLSFVYKEFCHILRDSRTVLILLVMPIVQIILFGFAISTDVNNVRLAVYDPSNDDATRQIVERFDANRYFSLVETLRTPQQIEEAFRSNRADLALVHRSGQKSDDRRTRHHLRAQRGGDPQRNGRRAGRRKS